MSRIFGWEGERPHGPLRVGRGAVSVRFDAELEKLAAGLHAIERH